jgi:hypothetical protein
MAMTVTEAYEQLREKRSSHGSNTRALHESGVLTCPEDLPVLKIVIPTKEITVL